LSEEASFPDSLINLPTYDFYFFFETICAPATRDGAIDELHESGKTILLVEQNVRKALDLSDNCYVLEVGRIVEQGLSEEIARSTKVRAAYLGLPADV